MELTPHLSRLLFQHDCVIVPGLGGFLCSYKKPEFNIQGGFILPARKSVAFNQNLNNNDGLLANHLAQKGAGNFNAALEKINAWVGQLHQLLQQGQTVTLDGIGTLTYNEEKKVVFVPHPDANFLSETYGLGKVMMGNATAPAKQPVAAPVSKPKPEEKPVSQKQTVVLAQPLDEEKVEVTEKKQPTTKAAPTIPPPRQKRKKVSFLRRIVFTLLILLVISALFILQDFIYHAKINTGSIVSPESMYSAPATNDKNENTAQSSENQTQEGSTAKAVTTLSTESSQKNTDAQLRVDTYTPPKTQTDSVFYIIAGAFKSEENANDLLNVLEHKGYSPKIIKVRSSSLYRVGYRQYTTRKEAESRLNAVREKENNRAAWVLAVKN